MYKDYKALVESYRRMFGLVDAIHFNSQNTSEVYARYISVPPESKVIPITHSGVNDHRKYRNYDDSLLKLGFIGNEAPYKGLPFLKKVISRLNDEGYKDRILLYVYGGRMGYDDIMKNIEYKGRFKESQMESVYDSFDLLVVPSIWNETFGFTVIEAIQYGVPALVSNLVGAKDIVCQYNPKFVYKTEEDLYQILFRMIDNKDELRIYNKSIVETPWQWSMDYHSKDIVNQLYCNNSSRE